MSPFDTLIDELNLDFLDRLDRHERIFALNNKQELFKSIMRDEPKKQKTLFFRKHRKVDMGQLETELKTMHKSYQADAHKRRIEKRKRMAGSIPEILRQAKEKFLTGEITGEQLSQIEARVHRLNATAASRGDIR